MPILGGEQFGSIPSWDMFMHKGDMGEKAEIGKAESRNRTAEGGGQRTEDSERRRAVQCGFDFSGAACEFERGRVGSSHHDDHVIAEMMPL